MDSLFPHTPPPPLASATPALGAAKPAPPQTGADSASAVGTLVRVAVERGIDTHPSPPQKAASPASNAASTISSSGAHARGEQGHGLTYAVPPGMSLDVGRRVEVPLGRGDARAAGVVVAVGGAELLGGLPASRVKPVLRDTGAGLTGELVELARWISGYYVCPLGMVLSAMLPAAVKKRTGLRSVRLLGRAGAQREAEALKAGKLPPTAAAAWAGVTALDPAAFPLSPDELAARLRTPTMGPINRLVRAGLLEEFSVESVRASGGVPTDRGIEAGRRQAEFGESPRLPELTKEQAVAVEGISAGLARFGVHVLLGVTGSGKTEVYLRVLARVLEAGKTAIVLVPEISLTPQTAGRFVERFAGLGGVAVLHSGLSQSQRHREWARACGGDGSGAGGGGARVVVGARSAIFAPLDNLGLIVVDEEHAGDYKQDQLPRYHARDVAIVRARMAGCPVILGSATPSLETWVNAGAGAAVEGGGGKYALWTLSQRVGAAALPKVEVVDIADERRLRRAATRTQNAHLHLLGPTLEKAIADTLEGRDAPGQEPGQVLLLLNRRGYASYIACPNQTCGWVMACDECDARMVQHRVISGQHPRKGVVRCHHCLAQKLLPETCPLCSARTIALGLGTQRVEHELAHKFGHLLGGEGATAGGVSATAAWSSAGTPDDEGGWTLPPGLARVDGDTMGSAKDYFDTLGRFAKGELRMLVGTQMIAKGLDFPSVRLVGVLNADSALSLPDFRAAERTFQLVAQVAGRAGRGRTPGRVIVQTMDPHSPAIVHAAEHDYAGFAREELAARAEAGLPPMSRMARIVCRDEDLAKATEHAKSVAETLRAALAVLAQGGTPGAAGTSIIGPAPCPVSRIGGFHRQEVLIISPGRAVIQSILGSARGQGLLVSDARTAVDIDPIALL
jgi:primosomal protein N' (replication factor Y)